MITLVRMWLLLTVATGVLFMAIVVLQGLTRSGRRALERVSSSAPAPRPLAAAVRQH